MQRGILLDFLAMAEAPVEIRIPARTSDNTLKPGAIPFKQFAQFTEALSDIVESVIATARDGAPEGATDDQYLVKFDRVDHNSVDWCLLVAPAVAPHFKPVVEAIKTKNFDKLDPAVAHRTVEAHKVARRLGWHWGIEFPRNGKDAASGKVEFDKAELAPSEEIRLERQTFSYRTKLRATVIRVGNIQASVRFQLMNGKTYDSRVPRAFAKSLNTYTDYIFDGRAIADADTLQILEFKIRDAEPVVERDLDKALARLAEMALPEFITTDTVEFFQQG
ncbi:MAG: hypothetical protein BroJett014_05930 [Planctomycetota bacterium]|nr:MAG: hypothetical protein BroJett014_05930 [Planctomycetota bacterium]